MAGQHWVDNSGTLYSPLLSEEVEHKAQPQLKFMQFCELKEEWGKNAGQTFVYDMVGNSTTQGTRLTETSTIPHSGYAIAQGTATLYEFGLTIPWTRLYEELAQPDIRAVPNKVLGDDYAKAMDTEAEAEFNNCRHRYVGTGTAGGVWTTNGTATDTCTSQFNTYHAKTMIDYMFQTLNCGPFSGDEYMAICSTNAKRGIYDEVEDILMYTKFPATGEFGKYYDCRFVRTNSTLSNAMGASSAYGEAYIFGDGNPVAMGVAVEMEIRQKEITDSGRSRGLTWYAIKGFDLRGKNNPNNHVVKYCSNGDAMTR